MTGQLSLPVRLGEAQVVTGQLSLPVRLGEALEVLTFSDENKLE